MPINVSVLLLLFILLLLVGAWLASALMQDAGYVLMVWQGWQLQTSVGFAVLLTLLFAVLFVLVLLLLGTLVVFPHRRRQQRHAEQGAHQLQQFERAATYRLLNAPQQAFDCLQGPLASGRPHLLPLLQAGQALDAGLFQAAAQMLEQVPAPADELAMLLQIRLALAQQLPEVALPLMQYLRQTPADPLRQQFEPAAERYLDQLWLMWATRYPWQALAQPIPTTLDAAQWALFLAALWHRFEQAEAVQYGVLYTCFDQQSDALQQVNALAWVRVLSQLPEGQSRAWLLLNRVLAVRFETCLLPFLLQLARDFALPLGDRQTGELLQQLAARYPGQPTLRLAQARWQDALGQPDEADQLAQDWPSDGVSARLSVLRELDRHPALQLPLSCAVYAFSFLGEC